MDERYSIDDEPTVFHNIVRRNGKYVATGFATCCNMVMRGRLKWLNETNGGKNIPPDDNSIYADEFKAYTVSNHTTRDPETEEHLRQTVNDRD